MTVSGAVSCVLLVREASSCPRLTHPEIFSLKITFMEKSRNKSSHQPCLTRTCSFPLKETLSLWAVTPPHLFLPLREPTGLFSVSGLPVGTCHVRGFTARGFVHQCGV